MKSGTTSHPIFRSLKERLGVPQYCVVSNLESVWTMAAQFADDGDLSRSTPSDCSRFRNLAGFGNSNASFWNRSVRRRERFWNARAIACGVSGIC